MPAAAPTPPRVLQVLACDTNAGTEIMLATLVERMDARQVRSAVAILGAPGPIARRLREGNVPVRSLGDRGKLQAYRRLGALIRHGRFDVVNAYGFKATALARVFVALLSPGTRFVNGVRGLHITEAEDLDSLKARFALAVERAGSRLVTVYDANSTGALDLLAAAGIDRSRMRYIPNGLDLDEWPYEGRPIDGSRPPVVLCVARFVARKRHQDLLEAAAGLAREGHAFRLVLAGDGPTLPSMRALAEQLGLGDVVTFLGSVDRPTVREQMRAADVFVLLSAWEGMPGTVMEAMACGLPVIGTRVNGTADLIEHEASGLHVEPGDATAARSALRRLLLDADLRRAMGARGRQIIESEFTLDRMVGAKQDLYRSLAAVE